MKKRTVLSGLAVVGAVAFGVWRAVHTTGLEPSADRIKTRRTVDARPTEERFRVPVGTSPTRGREDALVTIVEVADFADPFTARATPLLVELEARFGPDVRFVLKHLPRTSEPGAARAAEYTVALAEQGKLWRYADRLAVAELPRDAEALRAHATRANADVAAADQLVASGRARAVLDEDRALAERLGIASTPVFFVNGVRISGLVPLATLERAVEGALAAARTLVAEGTARRDVYDALMKTAREGTPPTPRPAAELRQNVALLADAPRKGAAAPLVGIVVFSDFECVYCGSLVPTLARVLERYAGDVAIQFRHFPLKSHARAVPAAKVAIAAAAEGRFWEVHDRLFSAGGRLQDEDLERIAVEAGVDRMKLRARLASADADAILERDREAAARFGVRGTPTMFVNGLAVRGVQPLATITDLVEAELERARALLTEGVPRADVLAALLARDSGQPAPALVRPGEPSAHAEPARSADRATPSLGAAPRLGTDTAPLTIVVFEDLECPYCARARPLYARLVETYGGRVAIAFKQYPLPIHPRAELAAVAALAAHRQGKFFELTERLHANQGALARDALIAHAKAVGLDEVRLAKDLDDPALRLAVKEDTADGVRLGITGTPTLLVGDQRLEGVASWEALTTAVDAALAKGS